MAEGLLEWDVNHREPGRNGNHDRLMAPHETYKSKGNDDQWVSIAVGTEEEWRALCQAIGKPGIAADPRFSSAELRKKNEAALDAMITLWTRERDKWEAADALQRAGVAAFPSMSNRDLAEDKHLMERGYLLRLEHPEVGRRIHAGIPWKMSGTPSEVRHAAPMRGAHTDEVLKTLLGFSQQKIDELCQAEIIK
jgi:benzylsuccinate CoA-transferase BbsF subunit